MAIREGKWRCTYCSNVNRGAELACGGCGAQRDKDVQFFLEDEAPEVTDEGLLALAQAGADWLCQFCQTSNRPALSHCVQCGAEKGTSPSRPEREIRPEPLPLAAVAPAGKKSRGCLAAFVVLLLLGLGFCATFAYFALRKTNDRLTVAGFEWQRTIAVEALRTVRESAWEGSVPGGARVVSRTRAIHHTERVQTGRQHVKVGTRDKGNGFFEDVYEDRPIYTDRQVFAIKVEYDVERWLPQRNLEAKGGDRRPRWPDVSLGPNEREARRSETYAVLLQGAAKRYRMELPLARWEQFDEGRRYDAVIQGGSKVLEAQVRAVVQRVSQASVTVEKRVVGSIGPGLMVLLGVGQGDAETDADLLADKIAHLRIFPDDAGVMNRSVVESGGGVLVVSQFTLYGDCRKGRRPSYTAAAAPEEANRLYEYFCERVRAAGLVVETGVFRAMMDVALVNQGPVTLLLDSRKAS